MAAKFPGPVTMDDNKPSTSFCTLHLTVPELKTKRSVPLVGTKEAANASVKPSFETGSVSVEVEVTKDDGTRVGYEYRKQLPHDIDTAKCKVEVKSGRVVVILCKCNQDPWSAHSKHFVLP